MEFARRALEYCATTVNHRGLVLSGQTSFNNILFNYHWWLDRGRNPIETNPMLSASTFEKKGGVFEKFVDGYLGAQEKRD